jgi:hypothetical protein
VSHVAAINPLQTLAQPASLRSASITIDNSTGTADLVQPLFASSTPSKSAVIKVKSISNVAEIYIGDASSQAFSLGAGDVVQTQVSDLSTIYIRVPAGGVAVLEVLFEV